MCHRQTRLPRLLAIPDHRQSRPAAETDAEDAGTDDVDDDNTAAISHIPDNDHTTSWRPGLVNAHAPRDCRFRFAETLRLRASTEA